MIYTKYDVDTGEIICNVVCNNIDEQLESGEGYIEGFYEQDYYKIVNGAPVEKPPMNINVSALTINVGEDVIIQGVPANTTVFTKSGVEVVNDGVLVITFYERGSFTLLLTNPDYRTEELVVEVL